MGWTVRRAALTGAVLACALAVLWVFRLPLFGGVIGDRVAAALGDSLGVPITIQSVEGDLLRQITLRGIRSEAAPEGQVLQGLDATRIDVRYDWWTALSDPSAALRDVTVQGLDIALDLTADSGPAKTPVETARALATALEALPSRLGPLDVRGTLRARTLEGEVFVRAFHLHGGAPQVIANVEYVSFPLLGEMETASDLSISVQRGDPGVLIASVGGAAAGVGVQHLEVDVRDPELWGVSGTVTLAQQRIAVHLGPGDASLSGSIAMERLPAWLTRLAPDAPLPPEGFVTLAVKAERAKGGPADYRLRDVRLDARELRFRDLELRRFRITAEREGELPLVWSATADAPNSTLTLSGMQLDTGSPWVATHAKSIELTTNDLAAVLRKLGYVEAARRVPEPATTLSVRGSLQGDELRLQGAELQAGASRAAASGTVGLPASPGDWRDAGLFLRVEGQLQLQHAVAQLPQEWKTADGSGALALECDVSGTVDDPSARLRVDGSGLTLGEHVLETIALDVAATHRTVQLHVARARTTFGALDARGAVVLDAATQRRADDVQVTVESPSLAAVREVFPGLPEMRGSLRVDLSLDGRLPDLTRVGPDDDWDSWRRRLHGLTGDIDVTGSGLEWRDLAFGDVAIDAVASWPRFAVRELGVDGELGTVRGEAFANLSRETLLVRPLTIRVPAVEPLVPHLPWLPVQRGELTLSGSLALSGSSSWDRPSFHFGVKGRDLLAGDIAIDQLDGTVRSVGGARYWTKLRANGPLGSLATEATLHLVDGGGSADVRQLRVDADTHAALVEAAIRPGAIELTAPTTVTWTTDRIEAPEFALSALGGELSGRVAVGGFETRSYDVDAECEGRDLDVNRLMADLTGRARLSLQVSGALDAPDVRAALSVPTLRYADESGKLSARLSQSPGGMQFDVRVEAGAAASITASGTLPLRVSRAGLEETDTAEPAVLRASGTVLEPGPWLERFAPDTIAMNACEFSIEAADGKLDARIQTEDLRMASAQAGTPKLRGRTTVSLEGDEHGITAILDGGRGGAIGAQGRVHATAPLNWRRPGDSLRRLRDASLDGEIAIEAPDLAPVARMMSGLVHVSGHGEGRVRIGGSVAAPTLIGELTCDDLALRAEGDVPSLGRGHMRLVFDERIVRLERLDALLGYAPVSATGTVDLGGDVPVVEIHVKGTNALLARTPDLRLRADLDVVLSGPMDALLVAGDARVTDALYSRPMDLLGAGGGAHAGIGVQLFELSAPPLSTMRFDVHVVADESFRIENDLISGAFSADLRLRGTGGIPEPQGRVDFRDVAVSLPLSNLEVERGSLDFPDGRPFEPQFHAGAFTRMKGYDLTVQMGGPVQSAQIQVSASPPLSQESALVLLATGTLPSEIESDGIKSTALGTAGTLLGSKLLRGISGPRDPDKTSLTDRINIEFGREQSLSGASTIESEFELSPRWSLRFERDRYDDYNAGIVWRLRFR